MASRHQMKEIAFSAEELAKDKWFSKNAMGRIECRLCGTTHISEGNYMAHTQGKRHQSNLLRKQEAAKKDVVPMIAQKKVAIVKTVRIGLPGYKIRKSRDASTGQRILNFQVHYPEIKEGLAPKHRIMSAYEQKVEIPNKDYQFLVFAAEPYETIAFKIPGDDIQQDGTFFTNWDKEKHEYTLQFGFKLAEKKAA
eukprot:TRINITY_DN28660_c0_g1_i1.p2 TRINITY_DN28660_c0_g1~~TRINITY_DN28660_c0_g1_i1.p2  ORF type:complete len:221 (+),score=110.00 TRINITY_DN28660_c0_g1_i1:80-664(+)